MTPDTPQEGPEAADDDTTSERPRSIVEIDPFQIDAGGLQDRLEHDPAEDARLLESLRLHGQQVPILVRPHPRTDGRYQIVYGRRRVLALRDLGRPVTAMIRDLDDRAAILAQGQENSARRGLSFIERVNFARQMVAAGYDRKVVADALATDRTLVSRMLSVAETVPAGLIERIGAAPGIGRDRWGAFARIWGDSGLEVEDAHAMLDACPPGGSDARFEFLVAWLERRRTPQAARRPARPLRRGLTTPDGATIGQVATNAGGVRIDVSHDRSAGFDIWLAENIDRIHRDWLDQRET